MLNGHLFLGLVLSYLALILDYSGASYVFDVHRALQYDKSGRPFGSRRTYISAPATAFDEDHWISPATKPKRQLLVVKLEELTRRSIDVLLRSTTAGALVLMPRPEDLSNLTLDAMRHLESRLLTDSFEFPVYTAALTEQLAELYGQLQSRLTSVLSSTADEVTAVVSEKEASALRDIPVVSLQGVLQGSQADDADASVFALVTHYDAMGAFPGLKGSDSQRSGVAAFLELARLFSKLYARTRSTFHLQYVLGGGGRLNYYGTRQWLQRARPTALDALEFALCLESLAGEHLYLHISRRPKDAAILRLYEIFNETALSMGVPFTVVHKKINVSSEEMAWEHEAFAVKKVAAATLSDRPVADPQFTRGSAANPLINEAILERNVAFVAEAIAQHIYGVQAGVFKGSLAPSGRHLASWLNYLASVPRATPHILKDAPMFDVFEKALQQHASSVRRDDRPKPVEVKTDFVFYAGPPTKMHLHVTKPALFELLLLLPICSYLLGLNVYFRGMEDIHHVTQQLRQKYFGGKGPSGTKLKRG